MELQTSKVRMLLDVEQKPPFLQGLLLSAQHVFAMFGATILVPLILGMPVSVALFASGIGTLIYMVSTQFKVPVYLGSSFAFIQAMAFANSQMNGDVSAAQTGVATAVSAFIGGPANTTYGENTGVVGMTRIASVSVIRNAAVFAIGLSFIGKFTAIISTIPKPVLGGMAILLYGVIASNGLKVLIEKQVDFHQVRNLIIASSMLVLGLGGAVLKLGPVTLSGTALCALAGVLLNLILPHEEKFQDQKVEELLGEA